MLQSAPQLLSIVRKENGLLDVPLDHWRSSSSELFSPELFTSYYRMINTYLHSRSHQAIRNISILILSTKILLYAVVIRSNQSFHSTKDVGLSRIHAEYVSRMYEDLAKLGDVMRPYSVHILVDIITLLEKEPVSPNIKQGLSPGIFELISLLKENEQNMMLKLLDATGKDMFRQFYQEYDRYYRYRGKA